MPGLITKKIGMTRIVNKNGEFVPVTLLLVEKNTVVQVKTPEKDGVSAVVLRTSDKRNETKQFNLPEGAEYQIGDELGVDMYKDAETVKVSAISKGKGFQGAMKRHNFGGGRATHGGKYRRAPGSIGTRKPRRTKRGQKMPGHMGSERVTLTRPLVDVDSTRNLIAVKGSVPGAYRSIVYVTTL